MLYSDVQLLKENPPWRLVLNAYQVKTLEAAEARAAERKKAKSATEEAADKMEGEDDDSVSSTDDPWLSRIDDVEGVTPEDLSAVHGNLIAHGFLKFRLSGRDGLVYQLTSLGRRADAGEELDEYDEEAA